MHIREEIHSQCKEIMEFLPENRKTQRVGIDFVIFDEMTQHKEWYKCHSTHSSKRSTYRRISVRERQSYVFATTTFGAVINRVNEFARKGHS